MCSVLRAIYRYMQTHHSNGHAARTSTHAHTHTHQLYVVDVHAQGDILELHNTARGDGGVFACQQHVTHFHTIRAKVVLEEGRAHSI